MPTLLAALAGCGGPVVAFDGPPTPPTPTFADPGLSTTGASPALRLWQLEGSYVLPPSTLPAGTSAQSRFPLALHGGKRERDNAYVFRAESPFPEALEGEARMAAPPGLTLFADGKELLYDPDLRPRTWRINKDKLVVAWPTDVAPAVEVLYPEVAVVATTREFATANKTPFEFVQEEVSLADQTRLGMLLPAPGTASWTVTVPPGGRFEAWLAMAPMPLRMLVGDGAEVVLSVTEGGAATEVARAAVAPFTEGFTRWTADLSAFAGSEVTVTLATEPGADNSFDHVFLGSPTIWGDADPSEVRHVVVIGIDTTRPDHFSSYGYGRPTTPELDRVAASSVVFETTWTPAPRTRPSFRSAFTGRRPLDAVGAPNVAEIFAAHGFATAGIVANIHLQPRFDFNDGFDWWWFDGQSKADSQVDRALEWLGEHRDRDTFLFLHIMDPHLPYKPPARFKSEFVTDPDPDLPSNFGRSDVYQWLKGDRASEQRKRTITDLYDAELRFTSEQLGRLFDQLDRMPGKKIVVLHSDHGEELFEHGQFEHNHTVYEETTRGLLWFRSGGGQTEGRRIATPTTITDIAPTLVELAGFPDPPATDGRSLAGILRGEVDPATWADRELGVAHLRYGTERWAVVRQGRKYILHTASGREELYDLAADPQERKDLSRATPLAPFRDALARAHDARVGRGWRIAVRLDARTGGPLSFTLPQPAHAAGIVDPEARIPNPANEEWGERPKVTAAEVGAVALSEDGLVLTFTPGPRAMDGLLYVLFDADVDPNPVVATRDGAPQVTTVVNGEVAWRSGAQSWTIQPGTVLVPPLDEASRMRLLRGEEAKEAGLDQAELCALGYVECEK